MYHLPLLPGYGPDANVRSSAPPKTNDGKSILNALSEAEENGYQGSYFIHNNEQSVAPHHDGYLTSSPTDTRNNTAVTTPATQEYYTSTSEAETDHYASASEAEGLTSHTQDVGSSSAPSASVPVISTPSGLNQPPGNDNEHAEAVFFEYGVVVFFGFTEVQEKSILEDIHNAGIVKRRISEDEWEVEECHYAVRLYISRWHEFV